MILACLQMKLRWRCGVGVSVGSYNSCCSFPEIVPFGHTCLLLHFGFLIRCVSVPVCATCVILLFTFESFAIIARKRLIPTRKAPFDICMRRTRLPRVNWYITCAYVAK